MSKLTRKLKKMFGGDNSSHEADKKLVAVIFLIVIFGMIALSSASAVVSYAKFGDAYYYFKHQLFGLGLGLAAFWFFSRIDYRLWRKYAFGLLVFSVVLLLLVFIPGLAAGYGTASSWITVFGHSLQPSEIVKLSFLLYLAAWMETRKEELGDVSRGIGPFLLILGVIVFLMIKQPDIGTLSIIAITSLIIYFVGGGRLKHILLICMIGAVGFFVMVQLKPYQMERFQCLFNPDYDRVKTCYQVSQSLIAVGSGGVLGRGLGESRQKFMYLPEIQGDSIFAVIAEETGLMVSSLFIFCYLYFFYRGFLIARFAPDDFGRIV